MEISQRIKWRKVHKVEGRDLVSKIMQYFTDFYSIQVYLNHLRTPGNLKKCICV